MEGISDGCQEGFRPFPPEDVNTAGGRGHRQIPQETLSQLNVSLLVNPDSFPRLGEMLVTARAFALQSCGQNLPRVQGPHKTEKSPCLKQEQGQ